jgi:uncharacterized membrane protein
MRPTTLFVAGAGIGAGLMYVLDPAAGRRRRALARDQLVHAMRKGEDAADATARDVANRARGVVAELGARFTPADAPDDVLAERVRAKLGHWASHPGAIEVEAHGGRVVLRGVVLARELDGLLRAVRRVRGVRDVESRLEAHERPDDVPALQGGVARTGERFELLQTRWSPTARLLAGAGGGVLAIAALRRGGLGGALLAAPGAALLARAATNLELRRLVGAGVGRRAVEVQKSLEIGAPVEIVFDFWRRVENFPRFMSNVREVRDLGGGRSHWVVAGPAGVPVEWEAEVTETTPNRVLAWRTVPGATVAHAGIVHFAPTPSGTRVEVRLSYAPPGGAAGHAVAALFGADPKREIDADLARMKTMLETGIPPRDAAEPPAAAGTAGPSDETLH